MILYHVHRINQFDKDFSIGNTLEFGNKYNDLKSRSMNHCCMFQDDIIKKEDEGRIVLRDLETFISFDKIKNMSVSRQLDLLTAVKKYIHNSKLDIREMILEEVRLREHPNYPSRYTCAWLTDEASLPYWCEALNVQEEEYVALQVEADGNIFVSTDDLLPRSCMSNEDIYKGAYQYWNPSEADLKRNAREYLLDGKMKILKRVN